MKDHTEIIKALNTISRLAEACLELMETQRSDNYNLYATLKQMSSKSYHLADELNEQDIATQRLEIVS